MSELREVAKKSAGLSPTKNMYNVLNVLKSTIVPEADKYYTFVYKAKTPGIVYDAHPVVKVGAVYSWGFIGYNFHWNEARQYSWAEITSNLYVIPTEEDLTAVLRSRTFKRKKS